MDHLVIHRLQLSEDLEVAHIKHSQALEEHKPVWFWFRRLLRQLLSQQAAQLFLDVCPQLVVCPVRVTMRLGPVA